MLATTSTGEGETQSLDVVSYKIPNQDKAQRHVERHVELVKHHWDAQSNLITLGDKSENHAGGCKATATHETMFNHVEDWTGTQW